MGSHHPTERRAPFMVRLAFSERELLERAHRAALADERTIERSLSSWAREALCSIARQVIRGKRASPAPAADPRQVELEELIAAKRAVPASADVEGFESFVAAPDDETPATSTARARVRRSTPRRAPARRASRRTS
jgi:hypothetical protein